MRIAGIDIGGTTVKIGLFEPDKGLIGRTQLATITGNPEALVDSIKETVQQLAVDFIGIGTAGAVDTSTGLVTAGNLHWRDVPLRQLMEQRLCCPVWVDNDAQAALMAEHYNGACAGFRNVVYLTLGTGIGGALLLGGKPWRGHDNTAGELGHIITHADGLPCSCSKCGCFEVYASASALSRMAGGLAAKDVIDAARAGDPEYLDLFAVYLHELGIGLVTLIMIFNPEVIVIGGGISSAGDILLEGIRREVKALFAGRPNYFKGTIQLARHRNDAGMIGAAVLAQSHFA
ncbi:MAG: ROK family protein [Bacillota bacterium]|nr:ROK family protein [Bacillota bacterium]